MKTTTLKSSSSALSAHQNTLENSNWQVSTVGDNEDTDKDIEDGGVNIVFGSAEQYLSDKWKKALQFGSLHEAEVLVVDEVHTVETWYGAFQPFFMPIKSYS